MFRRCIYSIILFGLLALCPCPAQCRPYAIATVAWIGWSPLHIASQMGLWDALGLDVRVVNYDDPIIILEAMKKNRIDLAMDMVGSLVGVYMAGEPVVAIAETNWSHGGDKIIIGRGDRLENHMGSVIGVFLNQPSCLFFLDQYLQGIGLRLPDFRVVEINPRDLAAQFAAKRLPAIVNYEPWATDAVKNGNGSVLATSADFPGCIPECLWGYRQIVGNIPAKDIENILRGWINAVNWMEKPNHRDAYFKILREQTFKDETGLTDEHFLKMMGEVAIHGVARLYERNKEDGGLFHFLSSLKSSLKRNGMLKKDFSAGHIFENRYILNVLRDIKRQNSR